MTAIGIAHVHHSLGFGGTQKSVETIVRNSSKQFDPHVLCLDDIGVRGEALQDDGYCVRLVNDVSGVREYLCEHNIDIVHVHGGFDRGTDVIEIARDKRVPAVLKSLHFGKPSDGDLATHVDRYLYVGKMIFLRNLLLSGDSLEPESWQDDHRVLYNPIDLAQIDPEGPAKYRDQFDIPKDAAVVGKIGRSAPEKWGKITIDALSHITDERSDVHVLLVNTPEKIQKQIRTRGHERVHHIDSIPLGQIDDFHNSVDVLTHASAIGECCPYVFLEAMATRTPIVVNSQPMRDNGQIELINHGEQGYIANTPKTYANATLELLEDAEKRADMGRAGRERVEEIFDAEHIVERLERLYGTVLIENGAFTEYDLPWWGGPPVVTDMSTFAEDYSRRLQTYYDGENIGYEAERHLWNFVTSLPTSRKPAYEIGRKGILFSREHMW